MARVRKPNNPYGGEQGGTEALVPTQDEWSYDGDGLASAQTMAEPQVTTAGGGQAVHRKPTQPAPAPVPPSIPPPALPTPPAVPNTPGVPPESPGTPVPVQPAKYAVEANQDKLNSGHDSPMYQMLRTLSGFDPAAGLTPDVLAALNKLGLGTFEAIGGDKLRIGGERDPRWEDVTEWDVVKNFTGDGDKAWVGQGLNGKAANVGVGPVGGGGISAPSGSVSGIPDISELLKMFGEMGEEFGGEQGPGVFPGDNLQQVGDDPFSKLITGGLSSMIGGGGQGMSQTGRDVSGALGRLLNPGQGGGLNEDILKARMESAREGSERFRSAEMDTLESELSERGILNDGAMATGLGGLSNDIAGMHATALRDIFADESGRADDRMMGGLQIGAGMAAGHDDNFLEATKQGTERQATLANIAMDSLNQNMEWQQFIASFGLSRDQLMNDIQMGRVDRVLQLLQLFTQQAQIGAGGYV